MKIHQLFIFICNNKEAIIWVTALVLLAFFVPQEEHFSLCLFKHMGLSFCPGCGLGKSIACFFHGNIQASLDAHPLGIVATGILLYRIVQLVFIQRKHII